VYKANLCATRVCFWPYHSYLSSSANTRSFLPACQGKYTRWCHERHISDSQLTDWELRDDEYIDAGTCVSICAPGKTACRLRLRAAHRLHGKLWSPAHYNAQTPRTGSSCCGFAVDLLYNLLCHGVWRYTKVDVQCSQLASVVGRTKLITLAAVDVPSCNFSKSRILEQTSREKYILLSGDAEVFFTTRCRN